MAIRQRQPGRHNEESLAGAHSRRNLNDPTLDTLLARDGIRKDELNQIIDEARETLARVPRSWEEGQEVFSSSISTEIPLLTLRMR